jgi:hypothetical protein
MRLLNQPYDGTASYYPLFFKNKQADMRDIVETRDLDLSIQQKWQKHTTAGIRQWSPT